MSKRFEKYLVSFLIIVVVLSVSLSLPFFSHFFPETLNKMKITNAVADVSDFDISNGEIVYLSGEWDFYWMKRLVTDNVPETVSPDAYVNVPNSWTNIKLKNSDEKLKNGGYASYKITLTGVPENVPLVITIPNFMGSYSAFIDGKLVCRNVCDYNSKSNNGISANPVYLNYSEDGNYEVVIEVSCEYSGGLTSIPQIATFSKTQNENIARTSLRFFYVGIVVFAAIMTMLFSFFMKDKVKVFWLAALCVAMFVRLVLSNEGYLISSTYLFNLNYEIVVSLVYVSTFIIKLLMFMHVTKTLNIKIPPYILVLFSAIFIACAFVPYFVYSEIYIARVYLILQSFTVLLDFYAIAKLTECVINKEKYSLLFLIGYCTVACAIIIDNFAFVGNIALDMSFILPLSFVAYISLTYIYRIRTIVETYDKAKQNAELSKEIAELNNTLMLSQIQPHFLYNTLNTIKYLVKKDAKTAESVIVKFSMYLRTNMDSLTQREPIPVKKELEHVKNYADIEKIRFGERLNIEYDIQCAEFFVPPLTIQPIVENAIKHGVNQKPEGGTVKISTREDKENYYIEVKDDGIGFDITQIPNDGKTHVGINNITERLKTLMKAAISVKSVENEGTDIIIKIPKSAKETDL